MSRSARVSSIKEALGMPTIAVPVVMRDGVGSISSTVAQAGVDAPTLLSAQWCIAQGLKDDAGSFTVLRSLDGATVALVSIGGDTQSVAGYRLAGASAARAAGDGSFAFFLPTEGLEHPWCYRASRGRGSFARLVRLQGA